MNRPTSRSLRSLARLLPALALLATAQAYGQTPAPAPAASAPAAAPAASAVAAPVPPAQSAGAQLAADYGCYNCHGQFAREAPSIKDMANELGRKGRNPSQETIGHLVSEMRHEGRIIAHQLLGQRDAEVLVRWLIDGAK